MDGEISQVLAFCPEALGVITELSRNAAPPTKFDFRSDAETKL
jgi:hypothetical protein